MPPDRAQTSVSRKSASSGKATAANTERALATIASSSRLLTSLSHRAMLFEHRTREQGIALENGTPVGVDVVDFLIGECCEVKPAARSGARSRRPRRGRHRGSPG